MSELVHSILVNNIGRMMALVNLNHSFKQQILDYRDRNDKLTLVVVSTGTSLQEDLRALLREHY